MRGERYCRRFKIRCRAEKRFCIRNYFRRASVYSHAGKIQKTPTFISNNYLWRVREGAEEKEREGGRASEREKGEGGGRGSDKTVNNS